MVRNRQGQSASRSEVKNNVLDEGEGGWSVYLDSLVDLAVTGPSCWPSGNGSVLLA